mmetsp:Transcript_4928/g.13767  ORF Transcript_4928/g.13767 Transcript_4928/m.13767 type:complete len:285 (+) Transcript_4928:210-1064(+)
MEMWDVPDAVGDPLGSTIAGKSLVRSYNMMSNSLKAPLNLSASSSSSDWERAHSLGCAFSGVPSKPASTRRPKSMGCFWSLEICVHRMEPSGRYATKYSLEPTSCSSLSTLACSTCWRLKPSCWAARSNSSRAPAAARALMGTMFKWQWFPPIRRSCMCRSKPTSSYPWDWYNFCTAPMYARISARPVWERAIADGKCSMGMARQWSGCIGDLSNVRYASCPTLTTSHTAALEFDKQNQQLSTGFPDGWTLPPVEVDISMVTVLPINICSCSCTAASAASGPSY